MASLLTPEQLDRLREKRSQGRLTPSQEEALDVFERRYMYPPSPLEAGPEPDVAPQPLAETPTTAPALAPPPDPRDTSPWWQRLWGEYQRNVMLSDPLSAQFVPPPGPALTPGAQTDRERQYQQGLAEGSRFGLEMAPTALAMANPPAAAAMTATRFLPKAVQLAAPIVKRGLGMFAGQDIVQRLANLVDPDNATNP